MPMIAMTTSSSTSVNPVELLTAHVVLRCSFLMIERMEWVRRFMTYAIERPLWLHRR